MSGAYTPTVHCEAAFGNGPYDALNGTEWVDLTSRFIRANTNTGRTSELDPFPAGTASILLDDSGTSGRQLDPLNAAGAYYGQLVPDVPVRLFAELPSTVDTFTGSDGATPTGWTDSAVSGAGASVGINSNRLRFVTGTTTYGLGRIRYSTAIPVDVELQCSVDIQALSEHYVSIYVRGGTSFVSNALASGYSVVADIGANLLSIYEIDSAGTSTLIASGSVTWTAAMWKIRLRAFGPWITARAWLASGSEPSTWQVGVADTTFSGTGTGLKVTGGNNTVSDTIYIDDLQIIELRPIWSGYADDWEPQWQKSVGQTLLTATDAFKILGRKRLPQSVYEAEVLADAPRFFARLGEGGELASDISGNRYDGSYVSMPEVRQQSTSIVPYSTSSSVELAGDDAGSIVTAARFPAAARQTSATGTFEVWVQTDTDLSVLGDKNLWIWQQSDVSTSTNRRGLYYNPADSTSGFNLPMLWTIGLSLAGVYIKRGYLVPRLDDGLSHHIAFTSGTDGRFLLDGLEVTAQTFNGDSVGFFTNGVHIGSPTNSGLYSWQGRIAHLSMFDNALSVADLRAHYLAAQEPWDRDLPGTRAGRVLDLIGWPTVLRALDTGENLLNPANLAGRTALDYLQAVAASEGYKARLFADAHGRITFHDGLRFQRETVETTSQATFSDDGANGSILYEPGIKFRRSFRDIIDEAVVTRDGGSPQTTTASGVTDPVNARSVTGLLLRDDRQARNYAEALVARFSTPRTRVSGWRSQPEVDMRSGVTWSTVLALALGYRVTVEGKPGNIGDQIVLDVHLEQIVQTIEPETWHVDYAGSPVDTTNYFVWGGNGATQGWGVGVWR